MTKKPLNLSLSSNERHIYSVEYDIHHTFTVKCILCDVCRADVNHDSFLDRSELKAWIMAKVQEHLAEAAAENDKIFHHLDTDGDGEVFVLQMLS